MTQIDYYFSTTSPFSYLAGDRLEQIAARRGARVSYKPIDLMALFPRTGGTPPKERHENRKTYRLQDLARVAKRSGLPMNLQPAHWPTNGAPSAYAVIAAQNAGGGDVGALVRSFLSACWAEERDVADDGVICDCLRANGFDPALANSGLLTGAETFSRNLDEAVAAGVFGAPFYIVGEERFWGQDRLEMLDEHLAGRL